MNIFGKNSLMVRISICDVDDKGSNPFFYQFLYLRSQKSRDNIVSHKCWLEINILKTKKMVLFYVFK